jgi:hypothetical protein
VKLKAIKSQLVPCIIHSSTLSFTYLICSLAPPIALEGRLRQEQTLGAAALGSSPLVVPPLECATGTTWAAS